MKFIKPELWRRQLGTKPQSDNRSLFRFSGARPLVIFYPSLSSCAALRPKAPSTPICDSCLSFPPHAFVPFFLLSLFFTRPLTLLATPRIRASSSFHFCLKIRSRCHLTVDPNLRLHNLITRTSPSDHPNQQIFFFNLARLYDCHE